MAVSQKDWKQTNSRIWLAKVDLDRGLDFPIYTNDLDRHLDRCCCNSCPQKVANKEYEKTGLFLLIILNDRISGPSQGSWPTENEQTLANLSLAEEATSNKDEVEIEKFLQEQK